MDSSTVQAIRDLLTKCSEEEQKIIFRELRERHHIHEYEQIVGAPAEMILEAVHRAPELTRRMLRGVIADAAFRTFVIPSLARVGWTDDTPEGNFAFDYRLKDAGGSISVQVKLQRSESQKPVVKLGKRFGYSGEVFIVETQKTRSGTNNNKELTRPYRFGEFDVLAVSLQPSSNRWDSFRYTLGRWLLPGKTDGEIATFQPVPMRPDEFWTDDFSMVATWFRADDGGKSLSSLRTR